METHQRKPFHGFTILSILNIVLEEECNMKILTSNLQASHWSPRANLTAARNLLKSFQI